jgi:hypothetical protein
MNKTVVVLLAVLLLASIALADNATDWANAQSSGVYGIKILSPTTPLAELATYRAIKVYSYTSKPGDQVDIVQKDGVYAELVMDNGVVRVKQCLNKALWIEALVLLPTPRNGTNGTRGEKGDKGDSVTGPPGPAGPAGPPGPACQNAVCAEQTKPECRELPRRQPKPQPCPLFGTPVVLGSSGSSGTFVLQNQEDRGFFREIAPVLLGGLLSIRAADAGKSTTTFNVAGGTAFGGDSSSVSQAGSSSTSSAIARQRQGQRAGAVASPNTTIGISTPVTVGQSTAVTTPVAVAVD